MPAPQKLSDLRGGTAEFISAFLLFPILFFSGCVLDSGNSKPEPIASDRGWIPEIQILPKGWPKQNWPYDNPYTPAKAILGHRLFFETALSRDRTVSCSSCHAPSGAFSDSGHPFSFGVRGQLTHRNAPTLANLIFSTSFMSEGGVPTLELQALAPLLAENEMDMTGTEIEMRLQADTAYKRLFLEAYGQDSVTFSGVTKALATYERLLVSYRAPYDRWQAGDQNALSAAAQRGAVIFLGEKGECWHCHTPPLFTDGNCHNTGLDDVTLDAGRERVTGLTTDEGKFKTPTLRNISRTAPYMHDGRFTTLAEVVAHYNAGRNVHPNTDPQIRSLGLTDQESIDLIAFLESLNDSDFQ